MDTQDERKPANIISLADMQAALDDEIRATTRAAGIRIAEFTKFTQAYAAGELSGEEATNRYFRYMEKWGDALPGVVGPLNELTDTELQKKVEEATTSFTERYDSGRGRTQPKSNLRG